MTDILTCRQAGRERERDRERDSQADRERERDRQTGRRGRELCGRIRRHMQRALLLWSCVHVCVCVRCKTFYRQIDFCLKCHKHAQHQQQQQKQPARQRGPGQSDNNNKDFRNNNNKATLRQSVAQCECVCEMRERETTFPVCVLAATTIAATTANTLTVS